GVNEISAIRLDHSASAGRTGPAKRKNSLACTETGSGSVESSRSCAASEALRTAIRPAHAGPVCARSSKSLLEKVYTLRDPAVKKRAAHEIKESSHAVDEDRDVTVRCSR